MKLPKNIDNKEIFNQVRQIDFLLRRKVNSLFSGNYRSAFKGQGMIFSDFREYVPGDDIRSISWNLTAKMSKPYIKTFEEDREAQIVLAVDISSSMDFGTGRRSKKEALNLLSAVVAFCAQKNNDLLGLLLFSSDVELYIPPKKGLQHTFRIIKEICGFKRKSIQTDMKKSFSFLNKVLKRKSHIFIFSDFINLLPFEQAMKNLGQKHDVISLIFSDAFERDIPYIGLVDMEDMETGKQCTVDFSSPFFQKKLKDFFQQRSKQRKKQLIKSQCEQILIDCQKDIYRPLISFFHKRIKIA